MDGKVNSPVKASIKRKARSSNFEDVEVDNLIDDMFNSGLSKTQIYAIIEGLTRSSQGLS